MKATFFFGRIHHAFKLMPVARALSAKDWHVDVLIADNSINIDPTIAYLNKFNIPNVHHAKDYLVTSGALSRAMSMETDILFTNELFAHVPPFWAISSLRDICQDYIGFQEYISSQEPDIVWGLHENNFWVKMLFYLAQEKGIPTYSLMEGIVLRREEEDLGKYSIGTDYTTTLFSWSEHDVKWYSDPDKIHPVGPVHLDEWVQLLKDNERESIKTTLRQKFSLPQSRVITFAPPRIDLYQGDFGRSLTAVANWTRDNEFSLIVKMHPFSGSMDNVTELLNPYNHVHLTNDADSIQYALVADLVITQTSTIAVEALCLGVPVVGLDMDYIGLEQLVPGMALIEGGNLDVLLDIINVDVVSPLPLADGGATKRIVSYVGQRN